jgi:DNA adenine methylase
MQGVVIESRNAIELIKQLDSDNTLFYADPPYVHSTRVSRKTYRFEMEDKDHIELAEALRRAAGSVIISGYESELYDDLYQGWEKRSRKDLSDGLRPRIEVLWMKGAQPELFSEEEGL